MNIYLDIETIPGQPEAEHRAEIAKTIQAPGTMKKAETIADWHAGNGKYEGAKDAEIESAYRKQSFDGSVGEIASIAWAGDSGTISQVGGAQYSEVQLLEIFFEDVNQMCEEKTRYSAPYFIGHFVGGFDMRFLFHRAVINGIKPPFKIPFDGWHDKDFYDTQTAWCGKKGGYIKMDKLAESLGIKGKGDVDGSMVWDLVKARDFETLAEYNIDDVRMVREIYKRINFGEY